MTAPPTDRGPHYAYPLLVALPAGRVQHDARWTTGGRVSTLCRKSGAPVGDGAGLPYCAACASRPNPIRQQNGGPSNARRGRQEE